MSLSFEEFADLDHRRASSLYQGLHLGLAELMSIRELVHDLLQLGAPLEHTAKYLFHVTFLGIDAEFASVHLDVLEVRASLDFLEDSFHTQSATTYRDVFD